MISNTNTIAHIVGAATTQVKTGSANLHTINVSVAFDTLDVYDATTGTTNPKFSLTTGTGCFIIDGRFTNGIRVITTGANGKATISYNS